MNLLCFQITYDGNNVNLFDRNLTIIRTVSIAIYTSTRENAVGVGGQNIRQLGQNSVLFHSPTSTNANCTAVQSYAFYAKHSVLRKLDYRMNDAWNPLYISTPSAGGGAVGNLQDHNIIIVPNLEIMNLIAGSFPNTLIMPLFETMNNIFPDLSGFNLKQMCSYIERKFISEHNDIMYCMNFLFTRNVNRFSTLSDTEAISMSDLYRSTFNITFNHNHMNIAEKQNFIPMSANYLKDVKMVVKSSLVNQAVYGDIPWYISKNTEQYLAQKKHYSGNFLFFDNETRIDSQDKIGYYHIIFFPEITIDDKYYPAGSFIGWRIEEMPYIEFRGELFFDMTLKEHMIIHNLFHLIVQEDYQSRLDLISAFRLLPFECNCRDNFINEVTRQMVEIKNVRRYK